MNGLLVPGIATAVIVLVTMIFRVDTVFLFVSVAAGELLALRVGPDATSILSGFIKGGQTAMIARLILLLLPVLLTFVFLRKTMKRSSVPFQIVPLILTALATILLIGSKLTTPLQKHVYGGSFGKTLFQMQNSIVAVAAVAVLLLMWFTHRHKETHGKHHK